MVAGEGDGRQRQIAGYTGRNGRLPVARVAVLCCLVNIAGPMGFGFPLPHADVRMPVDPALVVPTGATWANLRDLVRMTAAHLVDARLSVR